MLNHTCRALTQAQEWERCVDVKTEDSSNRMKKAAYVVGVGDVNHHTCVFEWRVKERERESGMLIKC